MVHTVLLFKLFKEIKQWRIEDFAKGGTTGGLGAQPPAPTNFCDFHAKTLILAHFFIENGHALSAVTIDNAKIFSQLMSESKNLGKISERRLQPLLV